MEKFGLLLICLLSFTNISAKYNGSREIKVGDEFTVLATNHSNIQSIAWNWDYSILELQGTLTPLSNSATFKAIKETEYYGTTVEATTYYYETGTTASGINKDIDTWKVFISNNCVQGDDRDDDDYNLWIYDDGTKSMLINQVKEISAKTDVNYQGNYQWQSSNPNVVELQSQHGSMISLHAKMPGMSNIRVTLNNGIFSEIIVVVVECDEFVCDNGIFYGLNSDMHSIRIHGDGSNRMSDKLVLPSQYYGIPITIIEDGAFEDYRITYLSIPNTIIKIGDEAFRDCILLSKASIGSSVLSIGKRAFSGCVSLSEINLPNNLSSIGGSAFDGCVKLTSISIPKNITALESSIFTRCINLATVTIKEGLEIIKPSAFYGCKALNNLVLPNSLISIESSAFYKCESLSEIILPYSIKTIGNDAFYGCAGLTSISIPNSVTEIGTSAFYGCSALLEVNYDTTCPINAGQNIFYYNAYNNVTLNIAIGGKNNAKSTEPWKNFVNIQEKSFSSVENVITDFDAAAPIEVYDINGVKVADTIDNLPAGFYIIRQGILSKKVAVK